MKKKIINGLLMMALVVTTTSSFVSCKDTVGDDNARFEEMFYSQDDYMKTVLLVQINNLRNDLTTLENKYGTDISKILNLNTVNGGNGGYLGEVPFTTQYQALLDDLEKLTKGVNVPGTGAGGSTTQNLTDWINAVNEMLADLYGQGGDTKTSIADLITAVKNLRTDVNQNTSDIATTLAIANTANTLANTLQTQLTTLSQHLNDTLSNYYTKAEIDAMKSTIDTQISNLNNHKVVVDARLNQISDSLRTAYTKIDAANERIDSIKNNFATKKELADSVDSLRKEILAAQQAAQNYAKSLADALSKTLTERIDSTNTNVETLKLTVGEMQNAIKDLQAADDTIKARLDSLELNVDSLTKRVDAIEANINKIYDAMSKQVTGIIVQGAYSPAFGIGMLPIDAKTNILAAYVGKATKAVNFPAKDANNYVNQDDFWTADEYAVVKDLTNQYSASADQILLSDAQDNAGKLYLTVNPSQVDFTDKIIELENSQGKAAPIALSPLKKSDYRLAFGWTRGAAQNGFYEADAQIKMENIKDAKARINMESLKNAAVNLYHNHNVASLKEAVQTVISQNGDIMDAQAAKATYQGLNDKGEVEEKTTFSEYSVATTIITPLSYNTLKDFNPTSIPGINKVESVISNLIDKVNIKVNLGFNKKINVPTSIKEIKILDLDENLKAKFKMTFVVNIDTTLSKEPTAEHPEWQQITASVPVQIEAKPNGTCVIKDENGVILPYDIKLPVYSVDDKLTATLEPFRLWVTREFTVDFTNEIQQLYDGLQQPMKDVNTMLRDLQTFMDDIQPMLDNISNLDANINGQIQNAKNDIKNEIISYIDKIEKKILSYVPYANAALQPVLLYKTTNGLNRVSTIKAGATNMTGTAILVPTSFSAELLAPAFKKFVVCTGAWDKNGNYSEAEAKAANNAADNVNFAEVIDGQERAVTFTGKAGYKYRIVYQALDYHGKIASGRYYVQF